MAEDFRTPEMYRRELSRMEAAMSAQIAWLKDWHLKVLGEPDRDADEAGGLIEASPFRAWYYGLPSDLFDESPIFAALGLSLESMQTLAEQLAASMRGGGKFPAEDYSVFMDSVGNFSEMVFKLMRETMGHIAFVDDLTGVGNENGMRVQIAAELERVRRTDQRACVALAEIGEFHLAGSGGDDDTFHVNRAEVMSQFAGSLAEMLRPYDQLFRTAEDQFMVVLPYTETEVAELVVGRLHRALSGGNLILGDGTAVDLALRFGIASIEPDDEVETVVEHAVGAVSDAAQDGTPDVFVHRR